ncbi:F-box/LRR-repeat protein 2 [Phytophthora citrophthora]|uniref:F-box/LRR-repeat protein 2 n=1 Tax=Phytophthora citrophthora TaxID=4793 RepID=A0AAD9G4U6_9STRA|nr:F-box/LRR-repeat protein 2 [Phytophthora citrophthora]
MTINIEQLPDHVLLAHVCRFVHLQDRWHGLARVSKRWRRLSLSSVHREQHADLTWCTGEHELEVAAAVLLDRQRRSKSGRNLSVETSQLQSVALYGPRVTSPLLSHLVKGLGCEQLRHVDVESKQISDAALEQLCRCVSLQTLALHCIKLTDESLVAISRACRNLTKVDLSGCSRVRDDGVITITVNCPKLQKINLTMCRRITDRSVVAMAQHASLTLEDIILDRCLKISGPALRFLMRMQRNLRSLSFARCPKVQGFDFYHFEEKKSICELFTLDLSGCAALDDRGVAALVSVHRFSLRSLDLGALQSLGSATFAAIARCLELESLNLSLCKTLENNDLVAIAAGCTQLSTLLLQGCVALDDDGLKRMATRASNLQRLSLEFCYNMTDEGFTAVALHCGQLLHLNVKACNQLTIAAFRALVGRKTPLETLHIGACAGMETTAAYFSTVKHKFPRCRIHWV